MSIVGRTIDVLGLAAAGAGVGTPQLTYAMTPETVPVSSTQNYPLACFFALRPRHSRASARFGKM